MSQRDQLLAVLEGRAANFPREWGLPPLDPEEQAGWIRAKITAGKIAEQHGDRRAWLTRGPDPRIVNAHRLRMLALRRRAPV